MTLAKFEQKVREHGWDDLDSYEFVENEHRYTVVIDESTVITYLLQKGVWVYTEEGVPGIGTSIDAAHADLERIM